MTDTLIRISCSETGDFSKLMLAPGLPMLDGKMLTYQVLQGWLHDLLAEPELDGDNVVFHVHVDGQRQRVVSRSFLTDADLQGPLARDFDRLRSLLFEVKPVSPSERLIFSRLQPPIDGYEGFLFKARTEDGVDRLVWCWGYQRRVSDGPLTMCSDPACSAVFVKQGSPAEMCPLCGTLFAKPSAEKNSAPQRRRRRPVGALFAAGTLLCAAAGTYFYAATAHRDVDSDEMLVAGLEARSLQAAEKAPQSITIEQPTVVAEGPRNPAEAPQASKPKRQILDLAAPPEKHKPRSLFDGPHDSVRDPLLADAPPLKNAVPKNSAPEGGIPDFKPFKLPDVPDVPPRLVDGDQLPELSQPTVSKSAPPTLVVSPEPSPSQSIVITPKSKTDSAEPRPLIPVEPKAVTTPNANLPKVDQPQNPPLVSITLPEPVTPTQPVTKPITTDLPKEVVKLTPTLEDGKNEPQVGAIPQKTVGERQWHQDYLAAYQQAIQDKQMLVMLFHDASNPDLSETRTSGFGAENLQPLLDKHVRVSLPINFVAPGTEPNAPVTRLLEHRSFRHLRGQAGVAIVDLTDAQGPNFGRVVSALPLPSDGRFSPEVLETLLQLPTGSIGQRSMILAVRTGVTGDNFTTGEANSQLHQLANRNARLMAQAEQAGSYDQAARVTAIRESFGDGIRIGELLFATDGPTTVQEAAIQAVSKWMQSPEDRRVLNGSSFAYGIELFQSPTSQRWFATCIALSR